MGPIFKNYTLKLLKNDNENNVKLVRSFTWRQWDSWICDWFAALIIAIILICRGFEQILDLQRLIHDTTMLRNRYLGPDAGNHLGHFSHCAYITNVFLVMSFAGVPGLSIPSSRLYPMGLSQHKGLGLGLTFTLTRTFTLTMKYIGVIFIGHNVVSEVHSGLLYRNDKKAEDDYDNNIIANATTKRWIITD